MSILDKDMRYRILRLAKKARGLYAAEKQALIFVADAMTMQDGVCRKALKGVADYGYSVRQVERGLHGRRRHGKTEFPGLIARGIVRATGNLKGGRAPGGVGLPATYMIDIKALMTFVPEMDDPDPKGSNETTEKGDPNPDPLVKNPDPLGDLRQTRSCSSSLPQVETHGAASDPLGESSPTRGATRTEHQPLVVVDGCAENFNFARTDPRTVTEPAVQTPFPLPSPRGNAALAERHGRPPNSDNAPFPQESQRRGQNHFNPSEDRCEALIAAARQRQLERSMTDAEIYRDYKAVFDRLVREADAYEHAPHTARASMPRGQGFDNPLQTTKKHRHDAAEIYRAIGRDASLAAWEKFLVEENHDKVTGERETDENGAQTGKFYAVEEEAMWLLHDFVLEHGIPKPAPVTTPPLSADEQAVEIIMRYNGGNRHDAVNLYRNTEPARRDVYLAAMTEAEAKVKS